MNESNSQSGKPKDQPRFNQEQYDMLKRCSDKKDMTEWNEWRKEHPDNYIDLRGADFSGWYLQEVDFSTFPEHRDRAMKVFLSKADFDNANLRGANFQFSRVNEARFHEAHLEDAKLMFAHLDYSFLLGVHLEDACLQCVELRDANVCNAHLDRSNFIDSHLQGSEFDNACLKGAHFRKSRVSGSTSFYYCEVDRETDFREVGLDNVRIDSAKKQLLEYNNRRMNWEEWYIDKNVPIRVGLTTNSRRRLNRILKRMIRWFWHASDYGRSTGRVIKTFFKLALAFAAIYYLWGFFDYYLLGIKDFPGIVSNLFVLEDTEQAVSPCLVPLRAMYFSIVTMTTLGLGDMYANAHNFLRGFFGHVVLAFQVILGYVLLGALVTRFAVLFTAGGPAGKFADEKEKEDKEK